MSAGTDELYRRIGLAAEIDAKALRGEWLSNSEFHRTSLSAMDFESSFWQWLQGKPHWRLPCSLTREEERK